MSSKDSALVLDPETEQRLGPLVVDCKPATGGSAASRMFLGAIGAFVLGALMLWVSVATGIVLVGFFGLVIFGVGLMMIVVGIRTALTGAQHYYLHAGGLVHVRNGRPTAVTWPEVATLTRRRAAKEAPAMKITKDSVMGYEVTSKGGTRFSLKVDDVWGEDQPRFCAQLERLAAGAGVSISG